MMTNMMMKQMTMTQMKETEVVTDDMFDFNTITFSGTIMHSRLTLLHKTVAEICFYTRKDFKILPLHSPWVTYTLPVRNFVKN